MIRITRISAVTDQGAERASHVWRTVSSQPGWITRAALLTFVIVIGLPIFLLFLLAMILATAVFAVLAVVHRLGVWIRCGLFARDDGRENVVVRRAEP